MPEITFPYSCPTAAPRLPRRPEDGQVVCDTEGNLWQYEASSGSWTNRGTLESPPAVTEYQDGLVTPDVFSRLDLLKQATDSGRSLPLELKILPHTDVYWYLFHSPDRLIRFTPESQSRLRIEVDRARLYRLLINSVCQGPKGAKGEKGDKGASGSATAPEPCFAPSAVLDGGARLDFDVVVPAPLTTDISLRLTSSATAAPVLTILVPPAGGAPVIESVAAGLLLDRGRTLASISYGVQSQRLRGSLILAAGQWQERCILARQKGQVGDKGDPGTCFILTRECEVSHADVNYTQPIVAIRKGCNANQLLTISGDLFGKVCVSKLSLNVASPDYPNVFLGRVSDGSGRLVAARKSLDPCKDLSVFTPALPAVARPALALPQWQPQGDCNVSKRAQLSDLNWPPSTAVPSSQVSWNVPAGVASPAYPWMIMVPSPESAGACDPCAPGGVLDAPPCPDNAP